MTTVGVEEEYIVVDVVTRAAAPRADTVVARAAETLGGRVTTEFTRFQVEARTPPCSDIHQLLEELRAMRAAVAMSAEQEGLRIAATGTAVLGEVVPPPITEHPRHRRGVETYRALHDEQSICAGHVHVHLPDHELAVLVGNHLRPWLPTLLAMTANSPYWNGRDTGYASWRTLSWGRWPVAGPPPYFESAARYDELVDALLAADVLVDRGTIFWDIRPSHHLPTIEVRVSDVPMTAEESALLAALVRALVVVAITDVERGNPGPPVSTELLRAACWLAAREGIGGDAIDPENGRRLPAAALVDALVARTRPALTDFGDHEFVLAALQRLALVGTGARRQRDAYARRHLLVDVVDYVVGATSPRLG